ncbi:MAG: GTP 3',8-cyclase MoaA [Sarcina sp.]
MFKNLKDKCGRNIEYLRISLTDACNLRCVYCMPEDNVKFDNINSSLTNFELKKIIKVFAKLGIKKIRFTGGEPLLREDLDELIQIAKESGINKIGITTNGILLDKQIDKLVTSGLSEVNISLDTLIPQKFKDITRGGDIKKVFSAIDKALNKKIKVKINVVIIDGMNDNEFLDLCTMSIDKNLDIRFIELMPIGEGLKFKGKTQVELLNILKNNFEIENVINEGINGPANYVKIVNSKGNIGFISPLSNKFCDKCNRVRITPDGYLKECLHFKGGLNLKELVNDDNEELLESELRKSIFNKQTEHEFIEKKSSQDKKFMFQIGG